MRHCLFEARDLAGAMNRMGFAQADPIRAPARAQDLIVRQRVADYRAGDLERQYPHLGLEELMLFAYGFGTKPIAEAVYPRQSSMPLSEFEKRTLAFVTEVGPTHPSNLAATFKSKRVVNAWGGYSQQTKQALDRLHHLGYLRVARRDKGIRVYERVQPMTNDQEPARRFETVLTACLNAFGPTSRRFLLSETAHFNDLSPTRKSRNEAINRLLESGRIESLRVDGIEYLCPAASSHGAEPSEERVRVLAPFDPLVRDRSRFEHLWGWTYRFEAYTPANKRKLGYYAMPVLWIGKIIGWANATIKNRSLSLQLGFTSGTKPKGKAFTHAAREEAERLAAFLSAKVVDLRM